MAPATSPATNRSINTPNAATLIAVARRWAFVSNFLRSTRYARIARRGTLAAAPSGPQDLGRLLELLNQGKLKPIVAAKLPLTQITRAHELMDTAGVAGKIVLVPDFSE